jgi:hypothetical protein
MFILKTFAFLSSLHVSTRVGHHQVRHTQRLTSFISVANAKIKNQSRSLHYGFHFMSLCRKKTGMLYFMVTLMAVETYSLSACWWLL